MRQRASCHKATRRAWVIAAAVVAPMFCVGLESKVLAAEPAEIEKLAESAAESSAPPVETSALATKSSWFTRVTRTWSAGMFTFSSAPMDQANVQAGRVDTYGYFNFDYRIDRSRKFSLRPVFLMGSAGTDYRDEYKSGDFKLGDSYVLVSQNRIAVLPGDLEFSGNIRVYAPTSKVSADQGMVARLRPFLFLGHSFSKYFDIALTAEPDYYFQSRTGYLDERERVKGNRNYGYESDLAFNYHYDRSLGATLSFGHDEMWSHVVPVEDVHEIFHTENMNIDLSASMSVKSIFLVAGVSQKRDIARPRGDFSLLKETESQYYLLTSLRF
jgi:hypothetical protein